MSELFNQKIASFDEELQTKVEWELQEVGWLKFHVPVFFRRKTTHELFLIINGPDNALDRVKSCAAQAATAGLLGAIAGGFTGVGIGGIAGAKDAFMATFTACLGDLANQVSVDLKEASHSGDWIRSS